MTVTAYEDVQAAFDAEVGVIPGLGEGESTIAGLGGAPPAPPTPPAGGPGGGPGWPVEFWELLHVAAFSSLGKKWALTNEQAKLLASTAKNYFDTVIPSTLAGPLSAYLAALGTVVVAKLGTEHLEKLKNKISESVSPNPASTATGGPLGESPFSESPELESPISFIAPANQRRGR